MVFEERAKSALYIAKERARAGFPKHQLRTSKPTFWAAVGSPKLTTAGAAPNNYFSTVWARKPRCLRAWSNYSMARTARGHGDARTFTQADTSKEIGYRHYSLIFPLKFNDFFLVALVI